MTKINTRIAIGILFLGILSFASLLIARANHSAAKDEAGFFLQLNPDFGCEEKKIKPLKLNSKGKKVQYLQSCLAFFDAEIEVNSVYDSQTQEALKWVFEHYFNKKINGEKLSKKAAEELKRFIEGAKDRLANPLQESIQYSYEEEESMDAKAEVQKALKEDVPKMLSEIRRLAREELEIELPERVPEKSQYEGIEGHYHTFVGYFDRIEKLYKEGDYERALEVVHNIKPRYEEVLSSIPEYKEQHMRGVAAMAQKKADEEASAAFNKRQEEGYKAVRKQLADAKAAEEKTKKEAKACVDRHLKFTPPKNYAMDIYQPGGALCPRLFFIPSATYSYWSDELQKTVYEGGPRITIEFAVPQQDYLEGRFAIEKREEKASLKTINGTPWYYMKLTDENSLTTGDSYEAFVDITQIRFTTLLNIGDPGKDPKVLPKIKSDFENMMKTVIIRTDVPGKIEPAVSLTKEMLLLQGSWKLYKRFFKDDLEAGFDKNPLAGSPVKAHLSAFRLNKICSFIQEENTSKCYSGYVPYKLEGSTLIFKESGEDKRLEILKNTASELEILYGNGTKEIFQKTSNEAPSGR